MILIKVYLHRNQCCMTSFFFLITQNKLKILLKTSLKKTNNSMESLPGHVDKPSNDYDVNKMIKEKNYSTNQSMNQC